MLKIFEINVEMISHGSHEKKIRKRENAVTNYEQGLLINYSI